MRALYWALRELVDGRLPGKALAVILAVTLLHGLLLLVATLTNRRWRWVRPGALASSTLAVVLTGVLLAASRARMRNLLVTDELFTDPSDRWGQTLETWSLVSQARFLVGAVVAATLAAVVFSILREGSLPFRRRLWLFGSVAVPISLVAMFVRGLRVSPDCWDGYADLAMRISWLMDAAARGNEITQLAKLTLAAGAVAAIAWFCVLAVRDAKRGLLVSRLDVFGASGVLGLGIFAVLAARPFAHDARHSIPAASLLNWCYVDRALAEQLPEGAPSSVALEAPLVELQGRKASVDGMPAAGPAELQQTLANKHELWHLINPDQSDAVLTVAVATAAGQPLERMLPWLEAIRHSGFDRVGALCRVAPAPVTHTATLGTLVHRRCTIHVLTRLPTAGEEAEHGTWGQWIRQYAP